MQKQLNQKEDMLFLKSNQKFLPRNFWVETKRPFPLFFLFYEKIIYFINIF